MTTTWRNWLGNQRGTPHEIVSPTRVDDVVRCVERARERRQRVRVVGAGFAWSPLVPVDGVLLSTRAMRRVREVDTARQRITVETGATVRDVVEAAARSGMCVRSPSMFLGLSVGGLIATGSHGTGRDVATFGDSVVGFELVKPSGEVLQVTAPGSDLWRAVITNLGALGVVTAVTLQCEPMFNIMERHQRVPLEASGALIPGLVAEHDFVELFWVPSTAEALFKLGDRTSCPPDAVTGRMNPSWIDRVTAVFAPSADRVVRIPPLSKPMVNFFSARIGSGSVVVPAPQFCHYNQAYPMVISSEFAIPVERAPDAWTWMHRRLMKYWASGLRPVNLVAHARFCRGSDGFLAPSAGRASCHLEVLSFDGNPDRALFDEDFDHQMRASFGGRPHWGKHLHDPSRAAEGYGDNLEAFLAVRRELDPEQRFLNAFLRDEVFGLGRRVAPARRAVAA